MADSEELREQPLLQVVIIVSEIFLQRPFRKVESHLLLSVVLQVLKIMNIRVANDGVQLGFGGNVVGGQDMLRIVIELCREFLLRKLIPVSLETREGDFT
jgi:hypothetical protein